MSVSNRKWFSINSDEWSQRLRNDLLFLFNLQLSKTFIIDDVIIATVIKDSVLTVTMIFPVFREGRDKGIILDETFCVS